MKTAIIQMPEGKEIATFVNDYDVMQNMITFIMTERRNLASQLWNEKIRTEVQNEYVKKVYDFDLEYVELN